jgi:hypothetical protein
MFGRNENELEKPPIAQESNAFEILRVWGGENLPQQYSLNPTWEDPGSWGLLLVDVARHTAKAYASTGAMSEEEALLRIKELIDAEWESPTDEPEEL